MLGYAAVGAILAMYGEQFNRFVVRRLRRHVVIAGLGAAGYRLANAFAADGWPVVAIDSDADNVSIAGCRDRGIRVLVGDATDPKLLRQAGLDKAELLVALCGKDQVNIDVAAAARTVSAGRQVPGAHRPGRFRRLPPVAGHEGAGPGGPGRVGLPARTGQPLGGGGRAPSR